MSDVDFYNRECWQRANKLKVAVDKSKLINNATESQTAWAEVKKAFKKNPTTDTEYSKVFDAILTWKGTIPQSIQDASVSEPFKDFQNCLNNRQTHQEQLKKQSGNGNLGWLIFFILLAIGVGIALWYSFSG
mgnify:CR=1 FL=1